MFSSRFYAAYISAITTCLLMLLSSCTSAPADEIPEDVEQLDNLSVILSDAEPAHSIELNEDVVYGDTEDVILGQIMSTTVDEEGRVFIADRDKNIIHVYEPNGDYLTHVGNEGEGPGEFGNIGSLRIDDQYLYGYDYNKRSVNVYELESFEFSHTISLLQEDQDEDELSGLYPSQYYVRSEGLLVSFNQAFRSDDLEDERKTLYYLADEDGTPSEKILEQQSREVHTDRSENSFMVMYLPFGRKSMLELADDDRIYTAWSEDFLIKVHNADGSYERAIYHPYKKSELDKREILKDYEGERQRRIVRNAEAPDTWPALNSMVVDDEGRLWISTITDNRNEYDWWVIDEGGELLAQFTWPESRSLAEVSNDKLYARGEDEETGLEQVVRYNIEF